MYELYKGKVSINGEDDSKESQGKLVYGNYELISSIVQTSHEEKLAWDENIYYYFVRAVGGDSSSQNSNVFIIDTSVVDSDGDGLADQMELELGSDPNNVDTNGNGIPDGYEYNILESDPSDLESIVATLDFDEDGLTNLEEYELGTDPWSPDTDGDGLTDGEEVHDLWNRSTKSGYRR